MHINWKHTDVAMPILSTHEIAKNQRSLEYVEHDGKIHHHKAGDATNCVEAGGVYFVKLFVPRRLTKPGGKHLCVPDGTSGFARPGAAA